MRRAERGQSLFVLLALAAPAMTLAETAPPQIYYSTFPANVTGAGVGIVADNAGNAYVLTNDGGISLVSPQGVISAAGSVSGSPAAIAVNFANGATYVSWMDFSSGNSYVSQIGGSQVLLPTANFAYVSGIAVDSNTGHVYAVETYFPPTDTNGDGALLVLEYDAGLNGPLKSVTIDKGDAAYLEADGPSAAVDSAGNVYVAAFQNDFTPQPAPLRPLEHDAVLALKFSPHLTQTLYNHEFDVGLLPAFFPFPVDIAADPAGDAYLAVSADLADVSGNGYRGGVLAKLNPAAGAVFTNNTISLGGNPQGGFTSEFPAVAGDAASNSYVLANINDASGSHVQAVKYAPDGSIAWNFGIFGNNGTSGGNAIATDAQSNVYMVGQNSSASGNFTYVAKFGQGTGAAVLTAVSAASQDATPTKTLSAPLGVKVTRGGQPAANVNVRWDFTSLPSGTTGQDLLEVPGFPSTVVASRDVPTNANGESDVQVQLGNMSGDYLVAAQVSGATPGQINFTLHGKIFIGISLSTPTIVPLMLDGIVHPDSVLVASVTVYGAGGPGDTIVGYPVVVRSTYVARSGGHDHENGHRPVGVFTVTNSTEIYGITGNNGLFAAVFRSSWTGGVETLTAGTTSDLSVSSVSAIVQVKVADQTNAPLVDISTVAYPFITYSGNTGVTTYKFCPGTPIHHPSSHWATVATSTSALAALEDWYNKTKVVLGVNDMSLAEGGIFDICSDWRPTLNSRTEPGHKCHRGGNSVDIDKTGLSNAQIQKLTAIMGKFGGNRVIEGPIHYQFPGRENCFGAGGQ
ncbi:MAG TPA: hypothetical protein VN915_01610 [Elusimicrobiota bacterium]|nr:hypothetical protein [Elusimicrobiota bacterium]